MSIGIKDVTLFEGLSEPERNEVRACLHEKTYQKGDILFCEGDGCERVYIVRSGRVRLVRNSAAGREQTIQTIEPGGTIDRGWISRSRRRGIGTTFF